MRVRLLTALFAAALAGACSGQGGSAAPAAPDPTTPAPATSATSAGTTPATSAALPATPAPVPTVTPSGPFPAATVVLLPRAGDPVEVAVHVAADRATRQRGLMGREHVPAGTGMLFVYPDDTDGAFWMKDTLVDLSIAFADDDGRIVRILDMEPCTSTPCPVYSPGRSYRTALEVPQGFFVGAGVAEGDRLELPDDLPEAR